MTKLPKKMKHLLLNNSKILAIVVIVLVAGVGTYYLAGSHAAGSYASSTASSGTLANGAALVSDAGAYNGTAVQFGSSGTISGTANCPGLSNAAFCDNFNNPTTNLSGNRSGQLNGAVWGVSRTSGSYGNPWWAPANMFALNDGSQTDPAPCNNVHQVTAPNDIVICNGQMDEVTNDGGAVTALTMYPKQPFDFAGRTGKVVFDVSNNSQGSHAAWPEFWITDQPVPGPFTHESSWTSYPRNGLGIRFAGCTDNTGNATTCSQGSPGSEGVDSAITVSNYVGNDSFNGGSLQLIGYDSCLQPQPGQMNHYEIDVSQSQIDVYCTNAFSGTLNLSTNPLRHVATIPNANLNFTRGLIWMEDVHYNGDKFTNQRINTFSWDNVGFDGPVLPRDLTFDAPDNPNGANVTSLEGVAGKNLAYEVPASGSTTVSVPNVSGLSNATSAILLMNIIDEGPEPFTFNFTINGHSYSKPWPFPLGFPGGLDLNGNPRVSNGTNVNSDLTMALPVNVSDLVNGTNTITFNGSGTAYSTMNIDLLLPGAGGIPNPSTPID